MDSLFGSDPEEVPSQSGLGALTPELQRRFDEMASIGSRLIRDPEQYFAPMDLTQSELAAQGIIGSQLDPQAYRESVETYLSPYRDILTDEINRQFEAPQSALASRISEAGAFGGSRARQAQADLEQARLGAISQSVANQYGQALAARQQGLQNLLGFGGLQRDVDLSQRMALPQALQTYSGIISPLLGSSVGGYTTGGDEGLLSKVGKVANVIGSVAAAPATGGASLLSLGGFNRSTPMTGSQWSSFLAGN